MITTPRGHRVFHREEEVLSTTMTIVDRRVSISRSGALWIPRVTVSGTYTHIHAHTSARIFLPLFSPSFFHPRALHALGERSLRRLVRFLRHLHAHLLLICATFPAPRVGTTVPASALRRERSLGGPRDHRCLLVKLTVSLVHSSNRGIPANFLNTPRRTNRARANDVYRTGSLPADVSSRSMSNIIYI